MRKTGIGAEGTEKTMRIGLVLEQFDPRCGGAEQWTVQLAGELLARGHEVHVVARRFGPQAAAMPIVAHRLDGIGLALGFAAAAEARLKALALDVVHDMGAGWSCDVFQSHRGSWTAMRLCKQALAPRWLRPLKSQIDPLLPHCRRARALARRQYVDDGRIFVALSRRVADDCVRFHGVRPEQIRLIYNGVDTDRFSPDRAAEHRREVRRRLGLDDRTALLLIVAHNFRLKGVDVLLRAMERLKGGSARVHLAVVGGKQPGNYLRAARRLGVAEAVSFAGSVDDTAPYYAAADAYVHPTFYDSCSLVVLEALAAGVPVVTTQSNGAAELLRDGVEGYVLAEAADVAGLCGRIRTLLEPDRRRRMGEAARRLAMQHTFQRNADEILAVYRESVRRRNPAAATPEPGQRLADTLQPADASPRPTPPGNQPQGVFVSQSVR